MKYFLALFVGSFSMLAMHAGVDGQDSEYQERLAKLQQILSGKLDQRQLSGTERFWSIWYRIYSEQGQDVWRSYFLQTMQGTEVQDVVNILDGITHRNPSQFADPKLRGCIENLQNMREMILMQYVLQYRRSIAQKCQVPVVDLNWYIHVQCGGRKYNAQGVEYNPASTEHQPGYIPPNFNYCGVPRLTFGARHYLDEWLCIWNKIRDGVFNVWVMQRKNDDCMRACESGAEYNLMALEDIGDPAHLLVRALNNFVPADMRLSSAQLIPQAWYALAVKTASMSIYQGSAALWAVLGQMAYMGQLRALYLQGLGLCEFPIQVCSCPNLERLNLAHNRINAIPGDIGRLIKLSVLRIEDNILTIVPAALGQCNNLREVWLKYNKIENFAADLMFPDSLRTLDLRHNNLGVGGQRLPLAVAGQIYRMYHPLNKTEGLQCTFDDNPSMAFDDLMLDFRARDTHESLKTEVLFLPGQGVVSRDQMSKEDLFGFYKVKLSVIRCERVKLFTDAHMFEDPTTVYARWHKALSA
jgi:hypothetical protein